MGVHLVCVLKVQETLKSIKNDPSRVKQENLDEPDKKQCVKYGLNLKYFK